MNKNNVNALDEFYNALEYNGKSEDEIEELCVVYENFVDGSNKKFFIQNKEDIHDLDFFYDKMKHSMKVSGFVSFMDGSRLERKFEKFYEIWKYFD